MMTAIELSRTDRVNIDESVMHIYDELTQHPSIEESPFKTNKDVFMFAVFLGYANGNRRQLSAGKKHTIRMEVFTESDFSILKAVAIATTKGVDVLLKLGDVLTIAEEYAHVGIHELKSSLLDQGGRPLWNLVDVVSSLHSDEG